MGRGLITAHALTGLEARGTLFVSPGMEVVQLNCLSTFWPNFFPYK